MAKAIQNRWLAPRILRKPFDLQRWQRKDCGVKEVSSFILGGVNQREESFGRGALERTKKMPSALAYRTIDHILKPGDEESYTLTEEARAALTEEVLPALATRVNRRISWAQRAFRVPAFTFLGAFLAAIIYVFSYHGKAEEEVFLKRAEEIKGQALLFQKEKLEEVQKGEPFYPTVEGEESTNSDFEPKIFPRISGSKSFTRVAGLVADITAFPTTLDVLSAAKNTPPLELGASSVGAADWRILELVADEEERRDEARALFSPRLAGQYRRIVNAPLLNFPTSKRLTAVEMFGFEKEMDELGFPETFTLLLHNGKTQNKFYFYALKWHDNYFVPQPLKEVYSYVKYFSGQYDQAAKILFQAHSDVLRKENARIFLRTDGVVQQQELTEEDICLQDLAACRWADCDQLQQLERACQDFEGVDQEFLGWKIKVKPWMWRVASSTYKYHLYKQSLGPHQIIIGLLKRAAEDFQRVGRYFPYLNPEDVSSDKALVRTALNPEKAIFAKAMVFDYIVTKLKASLFSDSSIRLPINLSPFIENLKTAREYSMLSLAFYLSLYPELDFLAAETLAAGEAYSLYLSFLILGEIFDIKPEFPGLFYLRWEGPSEIIYSWIRF